MRIAVACPPIRDFYHSPRRTSALGARTVVRLLRRMGHEASLHLFSLQGGGRTLPLPPEMEYLRPVLVPGEYGPLSFFTRFQRFGPDWPACAEAMAAEEPDAVLISSFAYAYAEDAVLLGRAVRERLPGTFLAAGGAGPSAHPDYYIHPPGPGGPVFDAVLSGEAETGMDILFRLDAGGGPELLRSPRPARAEELDCIFAVLRESRDEAWVSVSLSRGCPLGCRFCSNRFCHGSEFRTVPVEKIADAAEALPAGKRLRLNFEDDNLLLDVPYFREVLGLLSRKFPGAVYSAENGLDYRLLPPELAEELIASGFDRFNISLGSLDADTALRQGREIDLPGYRELTRIFARRNIPAVTYFIAGLDTDTPESCLEHLVFLAGVPSLAGISLFYPVPGLPGFDPPPRLLAACPGLARGSSAYPWTGSLGTLELVTAFRLARLVNLTKKRPRLPEEDALLDRCFTAESLFTLCRSREGPDIFPVPYDPRMVKGFFDMLGKKHPLV